MLCQSLAAVGHDVALMTLSGSRKIPGVDLQIYPEWPVLSRFSMSPALAKGLRTAAGRVDILHNHSLWAMPNIASGYAAAGRRALLVTSPRGTLSEWALARSRVVKSVVWPLQKRALFGADMLHATSEQEFLEIRALGIRAPVAIVPNGVDIPAPPEQLREADPCRRVLFLSRIHPKKGVDVLLNAWRLLEAEHPEWRLQIVGIGTPAHEQAFKALAARLDLARVDFPGPVYGMEKSRMYANADLFVLPTHSENFGNVVAEALAHGVPAIVTKGAPWSGLVSEGCGWWVDNDAEALAQTLSAAMALESTTLQQMGGRGREWMSTAFRWETVAREMSDAYRWLLDGGEKPVWVRQD